MAAKKKASKKAPSKALAKKGPTLPATIDILADVGHGMEGTDKDSFAIPFLRVLQALSPQCTKSNGEYLEDAEEGMFYNSVTGDLFDGEEGVHFLPCAYQRRFIRWAPRSSGEGFKGEFMPEDVPALRDSGDIKEVDGRWFFPMADGSVNEKKCDRLVDTRSHFGILLAEGVTTKVLITLASTQIKKSKQLMSILSEVKVETANGLVTPPTWLNKIKLTTIAESNDDGSWSGLRVEADGFIDDPNLYNMGKDFHTQIVAGEVGADYSKVDEDKPKDEF